MHKIDVIQNKIENIEILRAVGILLVLFVHLGWLLVFPSSTYDRLKSIFDGNVGVDLFFVISGYVITRSFSKSFYSDQSSKKSSIIGFWVQRAFRLVPAAAFWLLVVFVYQWSQGFYGNFDNLILRNFIPLGAAIGNVHNLYQAYCVANPSDPCWCKIYCFFGHYWSLSLEQQFYIALPLLFLVFKKRVLAALTVVMIAAQFFWQRPYWSYGWFFRLDGLCWGILLAFLPSFNTHTGSVNRLLNNAAISPLFAYSLILMLPLLSSQLQGFGADATSYGVGLLALLSALIVLMGSRYDLCLGGFKPYRKVMLYIGSRSYAIYIIHLIAFEMLKQTWLKYYAAIELTLSEKRLTNLGLAIAAFMTVFILSELTYRFIEVPLRLKGKALANRLFLHN